MTQLDTIRYEVQSLSRLTPGQFTMKQHDTGNYNLSQNNMPQESLFSIYNFEQEWLKQENLMPLMVLLLRYHIHMSV